MFLSEYVVDVLDLFLSIAQKNRLIFPPHSHSFKTAQPLSDLVLTTYTSVQAAVL